MKPKPSALQGHTLVEMLIAASVLSLVLALALGGWAFAMRGERRNSVQCELDMQVRMAIERLRSELRISSVDKMVFHPSGFGPYTAISFPVARDMDGDGLVDMQEGERLIDWSETVVYHVAQGSPDQLLRTVFSPRDNSLTSEQRAEQLDAVVAAGNGRGTYNGANASTRVLFSNFFDWQIDPKALTLDAYSPDLGRRDVLFGTALLGEGDHDYRFAVQGKNPLSTGYKLGLDTLRVSPAGLECEAEDQTVVTGGASMLRQYMAEGSWGGNHQLLFDTGTGSDDLPLTLRIPCDRWEERNFRTVGAVHDRTEAAYDAAAGQYEIQLVGKGEAWNAIEQTGSEEGVDVGMDYDGMGVRMLIRGDELDALGRIHFDGRITGSSSYWVEGRPAIYMRIPSLVYVAATIAVANPAGASTLDILPGTVKNLNLQRQGSSQNVVGMVGAGTATLPIEVSRTNSYVVSLRFPSSSLPNYLPVWSNVVESARVMTVAVPGATAADLSAASWSGRAGLASSTHLHALSRMVTFFPSTGFFTSQIVDSTIAGAVYDQLRIDQTVPTGTSCSVQVRTGEAPDLSDAPDWASVAALADGASLSSLEGRYVQFRARLNANTLGDATPQIGRVAVTWPGETRLVDVGGTMTVGPDYGVFSVKVDDKALVKGLSVKLTIFKDVPGTPSRMTSTMSMEVEPRNSGK